MKTVTVTATVQLFPEVEVKNYKNLEVTKVASEVTDADVDADLERIQKSQARLETVEVARLRMVIQLLSILMDPSMESISMVERLRTLNLS